MSDALIDGRRPVRQPSRTRTPAPSVRQPQFGEPGAQPCARCGRQHGRGAVRSGRGPAVGHRRRRNGSRAWHRRLPPSPWPRSQEQNWVQLTQSQFDPIRIDERLWIVPSWHDAPDPDAINIDSRPGHGLRHRLASHHAALPAVAVRSHVQPAAIRVLDYGTGSGILRHRRRQARRRQGGRRRYRRQRRSMAAHDNASTQRGQSQPAALPRSARRAVRPRRRQHPRPTRCACWRRCWRRA
ncbi:MAG: 50S ribosomal protein L11 methyltransferase [Comamonadaceae bacterium]|nr:50S ribosomal protein L11 methyltransferase [Comamonadaceae bacterium]